MSGRTSFDSALTPNQCRECMAPGYNKPAFDKVKTQMFTALAVGAIFAVVFGLSMAGYFGHGPLSGLSSAGNIALSSISGSVAAFAFVGAGYCASRMRVKNIYETTVLRYLPTMDEVDAADAQEQLIEGQNKALNIEAGHLRNTSGRGRASSSGQNFIDSNPRRDEFRF